MENKYVLWIGGIPDYYNDFKSMYFDYLDWIEKGYNDVKMETNGK